MKEALETILSGLTIEARPYQSRIVLKALEHFEAGTDSVLIESPTGSGKTVMSLLVAKLMSEGAPLRVAYSAMRKNLLSQTEAENLSRGFGLKIFYVSMFDKNPPTDIDLLIVDEAHHDATASMSTLYGIMKPKKVLGLSATPVRSDRAGLAFGKVIEDACIQELIDGGYLSRFHHYTLNTYTPESVTAAYLENPAQWGQSLMFFYREDQCREAEALLTAAGVTNEVVTAKTDRKTQLERFERGEAQVLISMALLTEGFDCPAIKSVFVRPSIESCTKQMAGRVLRLYEGIAFKQIIQCQNTSYPFARCAIPEENYLRKNGEWQLISGGSNIKAVIETVAMAQSKVKIDRETIEFCRRADKRKAAGKKRRGSRARRAA